MMSLRELELEGALNKWVNIMKGKHREIARFLKSIKS